MLKTGKAKRLWSVSNRCGVRASFEMKWLMRASSKPAVPTKGKKLHGKISRQGLWECHIVLGGALDDMLPRMVMAQSRGFPSGYSHLCVHLGSMCPIGVADEEANLCQNYKVQSAPLSISHPSSSFSSLSSVVPSPFCVLLPLSWLLQPQQRETNPLQDCKKPGAGNALMDMYTMCGTISKDPQVLGGLPSWDGIYWNALLPGYAQESHANQALKCFEYMQCKGFDSSAVTSKVCARLELSKRESNPW